ncbi:MAG TPA: TetR/AcrR family transcriptional regulator [Mycobacteriales bacterium]|nr:TetR/AcrR family transcriptional regulator [Mycobacteriales bacterium]
MAGARGERTRARLLEAARHAFVDVGWSRARVEDVCRTAGVGHGTFYGYYANKADVLEALVRQHAANLNILLEAEWTSGNLRADVRRVIDGFVEQSARDADVRAVWLAAATCEPALAALVDEVRAQFVERIRANLAAALCAGTARPDLDVDIAAHALAAMVEQTVTLAQRPGAGRPDPGPHPGRHHPDRARLVDGLTDLWVHAVYRS